MVLITVGFTNVYKSFNPGITTVSSEKRDLLKLSFYCKVNSSRFVDLIILREYLWSSLFSIPKGIHHRSKQMRVLDDSGKTSIIKTNVVSYVAKYVFQGSALFKVVIICQAKEELSETR